MTRQVLDRRCPRCGATLITNGVSVWCTFVGGGTEKACSYGLDGTKVPFVPQDRPAVVPDEGRSKLES